jgi:hypothetical protein
MFNTFCVRFGGILESIWGALGIFCSLGEPFGRLLGRPRNVLRSIGYVPGPAPPVCTRNDEFELKLKENQQKHPLAPPGSPPMWGLRKEF